MVSKIGRPCLIKKAPPAIVIIGEGMGTIICSTTPPVNIAKKPFFWIMARIDSRILVIIYGNTKNMGGAIHESPVQKLNKLRYIFDIGVKYSI